MGEDRISFLLRRRDAAIQGALEGITLKHILTDEPMPPEGEDEWDLVGRADAMNSQQNESNDPEAPSTAVPSEDIPTRTTRI